MEKKMLSQLSDIVKTADLNEPHVRLSQIGRASEVFLYYSEVENSSTSKYPDSLLRSLVSAGLLSVSVCEKFFKSLIRRGDVGMLYHCIKHTADIPESCLVSALSVFLSADETAAAQAVGGDMNDSQSADDDESSLPPSIPPPIAHLVNSVLMYSYNKHSMAESLRSLESRHVTVLLNYLNFLLSRSSLIHRDPSAERKMTRLEVLDLLYLVNLSHGMGICLTSDRDIIADILSETEQQYKELHSWAKSTELCNIIEEAKKRNKNQVDMGSSEYCIRVINIP